MGNYSERDLMTGEAKELGLKAPSIPFEYPLFTVSLSPLLGGVKVRDGFEPATSDVLCLCRQLGRHW